MVRAADAVAAVLRADPIRLRRHSMRLAFALAALILLAGCNTNGDFGEARPSLVRDDIHHWVGPAATAGLPRGSSNFELTDDERQLRDLAYPLIEPPYDRQRWYSVAGEYGMLRGRGTFDRQAYALHLSSGDVRSPSARYERLTDDIRNDTTRLPQFFETAGRVLDIDGKRRKSLAYIPTLSEGERLNAARRIEENARIVGLVRASLNQRASAYRFALERLVVSTPSSQAVEAEHALNQLKAQIARYRTHLPPSWHREPSLAAADD